ncbi:MAG: tetratricopeptide repeat protein [Vicinamibacterales bacterium]
MSTRRSRSRKLLRSDAGPLPVSSRPTASASELWPAELAWGAALVAITVMAYLPALRNGFVWDDNDYVTENLVLRSLDGLRRLWLEPQSVPQYYPVTFTSFWLEYHAWGLQPFGYHLVNILLHASSAVLLWRILRRIGVAGAWMAAALFAVHPMQVESVAWVTERKNVLSGLLFFGAFMAYLCAEPLGGGAGFRWRPYLAALALFVGALLSKSITCSLPAVLLLLFWWRRGTLDRRTVLRLVPMFALGLMMAATTVWLERSHVGAAGPEFSLSALERMLVAGRALWFYPATMLWPNNLTFMYPRWTIDTHVWWQYLFPLAAASALAALFLARRGVGRGPLVAALCYAGTLTPALGFFDVYPMRYSFVADHFAYLPIVALMVLVAVAGVRFVDRVADGSRMAVAVAASALVLLVLGIATAAHAGAFRDPRTLWTDTLAKNPESWMAHNNLGLLLKDEDGNAERAIGHYLEALRLNPNFPEAHVNLGAALAARGERAAAVEHYRAALQIQPRFPEAHYNLGLSLQALGSIDEAIGELREATRLRSTYAEAHYALGLLLGPRGNLDEAIAEFTEVVHARPDWADAHHNLGVALREAGQLDQAIAQFAEVVRLRPTDAQAQGNLRAAVAARDQARPAKP